jgi:aryl-alcohol dehydrogenase-like predicted oxidoreductase
MLASEKGVTVSQTAIAWVLAKGQGIMPLIVARTRAQLSESLGALPKSSPQRQTSLVWKSDPTIGRGRHALRRTPDADSR